MMKRRILAYILFIICLLMFAQPALAAEEIQMDRDISLIIDYRYSGMGVSGIPFSIYKVANVSAFNTEFSPTEEFEKYNIQLNDLDEEAWTQLAYTFDGYVKLEDITPLDSGVTDANGILRFPAPGIEMKPGLYLVLSPVTESGGYIYTTQPFLICLLNRDAEASFDYDVFAEPKCSRKKIPDSPSEITRKVLKIWNDKGYIAKRPAQIVVHLLRNGEIYDTQTLTVENQWRYTWNELSDEYEWQVVEEPVEGYTTVVTLEGITFTIKNSYVPELPPNPPPDIPPDTPQTGTTWYLVPLFAAGGLLFIAIGLLKRRSEN